MKFQIGRQKHNGRGIENCVGMLTKVHTSVYKAPYTLSEGLHNTSCYEFVKEDEDDLTFVSE